MATRRPAEVFAPGEFLREELEDRGWSSIDLAEVLGRPAAAVYEIVSGKRRITPDTAKALAAALGTSPEFWMNLEATFQLWRVQGTDNGVVARRAKLYSKVPVREMLKRGWIEPSSSIDVLERRILDFLEIDSIDNPVVPFLHAARKSASYAATTPAQAAWLIRARQLARTVPAGRYSASSLKKAIGQLRTLAHSPQEARHVSRVLGEAGIRLVIVQRLQGSNIDGAAFWLDSSSPVIALSLRYDRLDNFWFTLLHELGHISRSESALDDDLEGMAADDRRESESIVDTYASESLIPAGQLDSFIARLRPLYSTRRIEAFAELMRVHPAIVVGQLHHRGEISWRNFRGLLVPVRDTITGSTMTDGWGSVFPAGHGR